MGGGGDCKQFSPDGTRDSVVIKEGFLLLLRGVFMHRFLCFLNDITSHCYIILGRRTRRTTRRVPHYKIEADSDGGSDNSTVDEDYEVASLLSSIDEGLT